MDPKEVKLALKEIREAIKNEKNSIAIEKCQKLLQADPENYMALVLLGAAYQCSDKIKAAGYLRQAVNYSPTPTLALQGLANCAPAIELPEIYGKLMSLVPEKSCEYLEKIAAIGSGNIDALGKCIEILKNEAITAQVTTRKESAQLNLGRVWVLQDDIDDADHELFKACLEIAIADSTNPDTQLKCFKRYLKLLYKLNDLENLIKSADHMYNFFPDEIYSLEWICKVYCESYKNKSDVLRTLSMPIDFYAQKLEELNPSSSLALLIRAIQAFNEEQVFAARELLYKAQQIQPNYSVALDLLAHVEYLIGAYGMALPIMRSLNWNNEEYGVCLSHSAHVNDLNEGIDVLSKLPQNEVVLDSLARCFYRLDDKAKLNDLSLSKLLQIKYILNPNDGLDLLNSHEAEESYEVLVLKGNLNISAQKYNAALTCMLKATRLKPYRAECFLHLGEIYMALEDNVRARKCLEKCLHLDPICDKAVTLLSAIYQKTGEDELNEALLLRALQNTSATSSKWIHFKLGLHYLNVKKFDEAIQSFRVSLKVDVSCIVSWECLGDAYNERGSYNSAVRVFQKILELDPMNIYAKLQVAVIRMTVRMYTEAIECFEELLTQHPDYLPGLKGVAEAHIGLANNLKLDRRLGRCKYHLQKAVFYLERAFLVGNQDMVWLWRLTANVFVQVALLPKSKAQLEVCAKLARQGDEGIVVLDQKQLLNLASRFYTCALKLTQNTFLWYELSLCSYYNAKLVPEEEETQLELAVNACKKALKEQSDRWQNWNLLGVLNAHKSINNLPLAQHCFIQGLMLERKSYVTWTNLGVLYLKLENIKLANQAFQRAQQSSPIYPNAWIGQAMIAEHIADEEEALDLFRHCQQFEYHLESTIGYAHWVCSILSDEKKRKELRFKRTIDMMFADTVALDAVNWYVAVEEDNCSAEALSFQSFLNARNGLWRPAIKGCVQALKNIQTSEKDKIFTNLGYMLLKNGQPKEAIDAFNSVSQAAFKPIIGLALAYFRVGQHQEAYSVYNSVLKSVAGSDDANAALILVAMASMVYASQGEDDTKTILYQCILLKDSPIEALYSACALGILHHDQQLTETILEELKKYERSLEHCAHIAFLTSQYYLANNQPRRGLTYLLSRVHIFPQCGELRNILANYLLENYGQMKKYFLPISQVALSAIDLGHSSNKKNSCIEDAESLMTASKALRAIDGKRSKKLIQKAIHLYPPSRDAWHALAVSVEG